MILMMVMSFVALFNVIMFFSFTDESVKFNTETEAETEAGTHKATQPLLNNTIHAVK